MSKLFKLFIKDMSSAGIGGALVGWRPSGIAAELRRQGWTVNPKRVRKRKFVATTNSNHGCKIYPEPDGGTDGADPSETSGRGWFTHSDRGSQYASIRVHLRSSAANQVSCLFRTPSKARSRYF